MNKKYNLNRIKILKAARNIVARQGIQNSTLQVIAEAAGMSKGSLYYYYRSKDDILYDIMEQDNVESMKMVDRLNKESCDHIKVISDIISATMERIKNIEKNSINVHLQGEALRGNDGLMKKYRSKYSEWIQNVEKVISTIHDVEPCPLTKTYAALFLAAVDGLCMQQLLLDEILADEELLKTLGFMLLNFRFDADTPGMR
ncbi:MAG: hypothetical protein CVV44_18900 [Spirochaetae bacterium HGW-Spirochaetae-1]|jgi:AcrR family transcriptional regulator|nr:MAG: hypothetical protein CVV44_18900 [Spirochaetae bacterium HGW-Spirochaetae-1]